MSKQPTENNQERLNAYGMPEGRGMYRADFEHSSCGIGFVAHLKGRKSHSIITEALGMLSCMEHRGGTGFDIKSGDGAGILFQIPHELFMLECPKAGIKLPKFGEYGVGMTFFPKDEVQQAECKGIVERNLKLLKLSLLGYRMVPVDNSDLGRDSAETEPSVQQIFIGKPEGMTVEEFDRKLLVFRNYSERVARETVQGLGRDGFNIISAPTRPSTTRANWSPIRCRVTSWICRTSRPFQPLPWSTHGFRPIPFRLGNWLSPSVTSPTMERSTPTRGISTGCGPARCYWSARPLPAKNSR